MQARSFVIPFAAGTVVGAAVCYVAVQTLQPPSKGGAPRTEIIKLNEGYAAAFDYRTRNPKWVLEHITDESANGSADRKGSNFFEDPDIEPWLRSTLAAYTGSGYDRGHMAPAADFKGSQKAMDESFNLVNISPQVGEGFNRDYWARFEKFVKDCTKKCKDVYIVTGPLWMPGLDENGKWEMKYPMIGKAPSLVSVPTHYYKVVLTKGCKDSSGNGPAKTSSGGRADVGVSAFVMPNAAVDPTTPLSAFVVPLENLETVAGTRFFPDYLSEDRMKLLDVQAQQVRAAGLLKMKVLDRQAVLDAVPERLALPLPTSTSVSSLRSSTSAPSLSSADLTPVSSSSDITVTGAGIQITPTGKNFSHLCDVFSCELPSERFWEKGDKRGGSGPRRGINRSYTR